MNEDLDILEQVKAQLEAINATTSPTLYNNTLEESQVNLGWVPWENARTFPSIYLSSFTQGAPSNQVDQVTIIAPLGIEIYGYVKSQTDAMTEAMKLLSDIKTAINVDEFLGHHVHETKLSWEVATAEAAGVVVVTVTGLYAQEKPFN